MNRLLTIVDSKYQRLEYLQSDGNQYIDTGIKANINTEFICDVAFTDISAGRFGSITPKDGGGVFRYYFGVVSSKFAGANSSTYNHSISNADTNRHLFKLNKDGLSIDDVLVYSNVGEMPQSPIINLYLFVVKESGSTTEFPAKCKLYSSQIYDNGTLVRNFVPVLRKSDNELGMLDLVEGKFYTNAGTGKFLANGIVGYTVVGSPTISDGVVSGFSSANYLTLTDNNTDTNKIEFVTKITTAELTGTQILFRSTNTNFIIRISGAYLQLDFLAGSSTVLSTSDISANSTIWVKVICENGNQNLLVSNDGINYVSKATNTKTGIDFTGFLTGAIGCRPSVDSYKFLGSIDMNETYIKINNKLWFNGQEA